MPAEIGPVVIALGANVGPRARTITRAIDALEQRGLLVLEARAPLYESPPMYVTDQPPFLNTVVAGRTALDPHSLMRSLKRIEEDLGREETFRNGPRAIDLDIVLFGEAVIDTLELQIPHPRLAERRFVLQPLSDILPCLVHPVSGRTMRELLEALGPPTPEDEIRQIRLRDEDRRNG